MFSVNFTTTQAYGVFEDRGPGKVCMATCRLGDDAQAIVAALEFQALNTPKAAAKAYEARIQEQKAQIYRYGETIDALRKEIVELQTAHHHGYPVSSDQPDPHQEVTDSLRRDLSSANTDKANLAAHLKNAQTDRSNLVSELGKVEAQLKQVRLDFESLRVSYETGDKIIKDLQEKCQIQGQTITDLRRDNTNLGNELAASSISIRNLRSEINSIFLSRKELQDRMAHATQCLTAHTLGQPKGTL